MRFTPTRVGTTYPELDQGVDVAVHPHACGDNAPAMCATCCVTGSPPRVWGQLPPVGCRLQRRRFTPTRVGTTHRCPRATIRRSVHPHACGDNARVYLLLEPSHGSPPRVWGQLHLRRDLPLRHPVHPHACGDNRTSSRRPDRNTGSPPRVWGQRTAAGPLPGKRPFTPTRVGTTARTESSTRDGPVHPHACGDNSFTESTRTRRPGSPPRVWGQRQVCRSAMRCLRFTPTRVGTTPARAGRPRTRLVHPHACGDNSRRSGMPSTSGGSPPRVWGQRSCPAPGTASSRFTPTRVGTTQRRGEPHPFLTVHPHACGDNYDLYGPALVRIGSPPRVWGQRLMGRRCSLPPRFTPTRVGTTRIRDSGLMTCSVHPHACGDNVRARCSNAVESGSPPRVWGQRSGPERGAIAQRFTPTRVGTTGHLAVRGAQTAVHPHACGDNDRIPIQRDEDGGSPPRVWGQLAGCGDCMTDLRFTPTRVGTTAPDAPGRNPVSVHPHACGDNSCRPCWRTTPTGSPPRVWGQLVPAMLEDNPYRFTPTRVGTTSPSRYHILRVTVHPHACGDNGGGVGHLRHHLRFTPTRVGTTSRRRRTPPRWPVHPHACGDNSMPGAISTRPRGSPPRVWGQPPVA